MPIPVDGGHYGGKQLTGGTGNPWANLQGFVDFRGWLGAMIANANARVPATFQAPPGATPGVGSALTSGLPFGQRPSPGPAIPQAIDHGGVYASTWAAQLAADYGWASPGQSSPPDTMGAPRAHPGPIEAGNPAAGGSVTLADGTKLKGHNPQNGAYQYVGSAPGSFNPAAVNQFQTAADLVSADPNNAADVAYIANNYYQGNQAAARQAITNTKATQAQDSAQGAKRAAYIQPVYANPGAGDYTVVTAGYYVDANGNRTP